MVAPGQECDCSAMLGVSVCLNIVCSYVVCAPIDLLFTPEGLYPWVDPSQR